MQYEIRRVPKDYEHPTDDDGTHLEVQDMDIIEDLDDWISVYNENKAVGNERQYVQECFPPNPVEYNWWSDQDPTITAVMLFEITTLGTPRSGLYQSIEELCADHKALGFTPEEMNFLREDYVTRYTERDCPGFRAEEEDDPEAENGAAPEDENQDD